uniref:Major facilitator superfamily (MFS) profile domain-containing protein n=1 Tax=Panagrolaimus superbus TaxID=310955 RepID=A0A914ZCW2_9BILA
MLGNYCTISMRTHIGVAMVCMVNATAVYQTANPETPFLPDLTDAAEDVIKTPFEKKCKKIALNELKSNDSGYHGTFIWSNEQQSLLFSAGFYGNLLTMFVSGLLISRFGPKIVGIIAMTGMSITMALSPLMAYTNYYYFFIIRFLYGILEVKKEALQKLENYLKTNSSEKHNLEELSNILTDFDSDKVIEAAMPYYDKYLTVNCKSGRIEPEQLRNVMDGKL